MPDPLMLLFSFKPCKNPLCNVLKACDFIYINKLLNEVFIFIVMKIVLRFSVPIRRPSVRRLLINAAFLDELRESEQPLKGVLAS